VCTILRGSADASDSEMVEDGAERGKDTYDKEDDVEEDDEKVNRKAKAESVADEEEAET
jgi:hypothetical protein